MARQTKIRIVGDPKLAMKVALCINEHFVIERQQMYNRTPYRYAKTPGVTYSIVVKKEKEEAEENYDRPRLILVDGAELRKVIAELNCASCDLRFDKPLLSYCQKCVTAYQKLESLIKEASGE